MGSNSLVVIFIIIGALALVAQTIIMVVGAIVAGGAVKRVFALLDEMRGHLAPVLITTKEVLTDAAPKIKKITANLEETSETVKHQAAHLNAVVDDVVRRSQVHINQADEIVSQTLDAVEQTRASVTHMVMQPVKWATAVANGVATGVQYLLDRKRGNGHETSANSAWTETLPRQHRPWEPSAEDLVDSRP